MSMLLSDYCSEINTRGIKKKGKDKQEYPTEPLRKISALQAILELAGKFFTGIANLAGNLMLAKACWDL